MPVSAILLVILGVLLACSSTVLAFGGRRFQALCGYTSTLCAFASVLTLEHAPYWQRLPLVIAAVVLLATAIGLSITGRGTKRQPSTLADRTLAVEPEDEIPADYHGKEA